MSGEEKQQIFSVLNAEQGTKKIQKQYFNFQGNIITNTHSIDVQLLSGKQEELKIDNYFTRFQNNKLTKITQIIIGNKLIKFTDQLQSTLEISFDSQAKPQKIMRKHLMSKKFKNNQEEAIFKGRDTKNVVKNVIRLFSCWLQDRSHLYSNQIELLQRLISKGKYNNALIISVAQQAHLRIAFIKFTAEEASNAIAYSKIHDKKSHIEAVHYYRAECLRRQQDKHIENEIGNNIDKEHKQMKKIQI